MAKNTANTATTNVPTDDTRQTVRDIINAQFVDLTEIEICDKLKATYGDQVWTNEELVEDFGISHFEPPYVHVIRKADKRRGTVVFRDKPRLYFNFVELREQQKQ